MTTPPSDSLHTHPIYAPHESFIDSVRKLSAREIAPHIPTWEAQGHFPNELFTLLGSHGYLGLLVSEEFGGVGGDYTLAGAWCEVFGELPAVGLTVAVNMHALVISHALDLYGTTEAKRRWLPAAVAGTAIGAYAFTEPGAGSDLARIRTTATRRGDRWVINGAKTFITNGARADFILVLTKSDPTAGYAGFTTFVVDTRSAGFRVSKKLDKLGWRSSDTAELVFEDVEVDQSCVLGAVGTGWKLAAANLNWERLMLTLTSLAGARCCLRDAHSYAGVRQAFGQKIEEFPEISGYLREMQRRYLTGAALARRALALHAGGGASRALVAAAKRLVCDDAVWIADRALQIHGGYGYTTEFSPERWLRDLRLLPIGGGTSEIMGTIILKTAVAHCAPACRTLEN
jgi:alkylation response protein AidB-like acyl-CoA dehydrogenase